MTIFLRVFSVVNSYSRKSCLLWEVNRFCDLLILLLAIVHGFPSSSFDYHKVDLEKLREYGNVLLYDQIGFGFSDKPTTSFTYSIFELADYSTMLFQKLGLTDIVLISEVFLSDFQGCGCRISNFTF